MTDEQMIGLLSYYQGSICADVEALSSRSVSEHWHGCVLRALGLCKRALTSMDRERRARATRVIVTQPGIVRDFKRFT